MVNSYLKTTLKIVEAVIKEIEKSYKAPVKEGLIEFATEFYKFTPPEELEAQDIKDLAAIAASKFEFMKERKKGTSKIRVFNPTKKTHGWESPHTVIELINDDIPFLVDSTIEEIARHGLKIRSLSHPVIGMERDNKGNLQSIQAIKGDNTSDNAESAMHFEVTRIADSTKITKLERDIKKVIDSIKISVKDWNPILKKVSYVITELSASTEQLVFSKAEKDKKKILKNSSEIKEFLEWLKNKNFVFLGYVEYRYDKNSKNLPSVVNGSELGILKLDAPDILPRSNKSIEKNLESLLEITKANRKSVVHRPVHMDYVGVKRLNEKGEIIGEHRFLGLFTSTVYYQRAQDIPIIRNKISSIQKKSGFSNTGHSGKALTAILEDFPRDELLQSTEKELFDSAMGIVLLAVQPRVRLFIRKDEFERFMSCIIFIPRDRMSTELRYKMEKILTKAFNGTVSNHYTQITESHLARLQVIIKTKPGNIPVYNEMKIEKELTIVARKWTDRLLEELFQRFGSEKGEALFARYENAFSSSYQNRFSADDAYWDIKQIENVIENKGVYFDIYESLEGTEEIFEFKVYTPNEQISLSQIMPILDNMGLHTLDEHTYLTKPKDANASIWIHRFRFIVSGIKKPKLNKIKANFEQAIHKTWAGEIQNDGLNKLILLANLEWRDIVMVRAYTKFLQQSAFPYSQTYVQEALDNHPDIVKLLVELFNNRFSPDFKGNREQSCKEIKASINKILSRVSNLAEDRVMRGLTDLILATLRTNYFQRDSDGNTKNYISFKFASANISWLPQPKPYAEIFVYSARVEGVHLRGGKVARGGLRWSDRREDFRTEVLGLMKAQMTKNSVIIPVGSKGGFVVKKTPTEGGREALLAEGIECYKTFLRGLLDVTDNIVGGKIKHPKQVVRHDGDDPYLVVAADKGTATFSDIANSISEEYNFWLNDAFASGGSVGYDHKKMGITAKGAWISVQRHFSEMGLDVDKDDFTVIGIGDMGGDVFGNGMLCSKHIKLVGAFNHLHIFLDPNPNPAESYKERKRLFKLPRSSWSDYDKKLLSKGGGIFERSAKSITLSKEIQQLLDIEEKTITPDELVKIMLQSSVDLLWNGGIGTYIKAKSESHDDVGDKANDILRVNGNDLKVKVIGEGGNLGLTQLGRIEYAKNGGRINTDAIDNSAGVDCSDHEVNIKIVLGEAVEDKKLEIPARNKILESMTDEVAELVLRDNKLQTQALTMAELQAQANMETLARLILSLEKEGRLNREIEFLPSEKEISQRHVDGKGLTRPELSVVLAYSKIVLFEELVASDLPDDPYYNEDLIRYFPVEIQKTFQEEIEKHPLRREIIATSVTNSILNRLGSSLLFHIKEDTGVESCDIARAYTISRDVFGLRSLWDDIASLKGINVEDRQELFMEAQNIVERASLWFLRNRPQPLKISEAVNNFAPGVKALSKCLTKVLPKPLVEIFNIRLERYKKFGASDELANKIAGLETLSSACDIVEVASQANLTVNITGKIYFELGSKLNLGWLRRMLNRTPSTSYWQKMSYKTLADELFDEQRRLTSEVIKYLCKDNKCSNATESWAAENAKQIERYNQIIQTLKSQEEPDFSMIIIAIRKVKEISAN